jgi:hypothetical protein
MVFIFTFLLCFILFCNNTCILVSGRNNYSSNDNQSLPSSSRASPPTVQGHHNQISSVPPRYQTATYSQQTNTTNSRPNVSTSYAAAADKSVPKTQQPPTSVRGI